MCSLPNGIRTGPVTNDVVADSRDQPNKRAQSTNAGTVTTTHGLPTRIARNARAGPVPSTCEAAQPPNPLTRMPFLPTASSGASWHDFVDRQYVDSHGQSAVAFAFCHLLGCQLLPRLKAIHKQRLYRPEAGHPEAYPNLQPVLRRPINWNLVVPEYDNMIKYSTALRLGTADTDAILRRLTRHNVQPPTDAALLELGKARRTIFLCRDLRLRELRREMH